jgi:putative ABC transport system permease protein
MGLVVRTSGDAPNVLASVRAIARELDPQSAVTLVRPLSLFADAAVARPRFMSGLMSLFAGVSLVVAVLGVYGLVAYAVARRTREIGLRIALGATRPRIARLVGAQLGLTLSAGLPVGLAGAAGLSTWMSSLLFGVAPFDAVTYVAVAGILALAVVAAIAVPVRRAMRVDPIIALRVE